MITSKNINACLFDKENQQWLKFHSPQEILSTNDPRQVLPIIDEMEFLVKHHQYYAVGFVAYEAANGLNPSLLTWPASSCPLVWFAVFKEPEILHSGIPKSNEHFDINWSMAQTAKEYAKKINAISNYIYDGETYQVNYSYRLSAPLCFEPWPLFRRMIHSQGNGYGAYINTSKWCICSASHELFFSYRNNIINSHPMKGTMKRGLTNNEDKIIAEKLHHSEKDKAENLMIVDMVRNDLSRIAEPGTVKTESLFNLEKYPTLWQMTSKVMAKTDSSLSDIIKHLFPAASITGAPKVRTMQIIKELETGPRGIYTGAIGLIRPDGSAQFNVAIRTAFIDKEKDTAEYGTGGGIVWDSLASSELEESQIKAHILSRPYPNFSLLETILWKHDEGYTYLEYHLDRIRDSAEYFSWDLNIKNIETALKKKAVEFREEVLRVRLTISEEGNIDIQTSVPLLKNDYKIQLSRQPLNSRQSPFLYHKTTYRKVYEQALADHPNVDDVLLFNDHGEITESCIANVVFKKDNSLFTPPVSCGLLAGVYRRHMLENGMLTEKSVTINQLKDYEQIYLINSVRGQWEITLA